MYSDLQIKLLELTKQKRRITIPELTEHIRVHYTEALNQRLEQLARDGLVASAQGAIELYPEHRMRIAERLIGEGCDPQRISRLLEWQEFEDFAAMSLKQNGFGVVKHFVFKARSGRREIDLLAWNDTFLLAIDCKHWLRGVSPSQARKIARAQAERAVALAERPDLLKKRGMDSVEKRSLMPVIFCLGDPRQPIVDGVPIVAVSKLISFLYGISPVDDKIHMIPVKAQSEQSTLV